MPKIGKTLRISNLPPPYFGQSACVQIGYNEHGDAIGDRHEMEVVEFIPAKLHSEVARDEHEEYNARVAYGVREYDELTINNRGRIPPFSQYVHGDDEDNGYNTKQLKVALTFLRHGRREFM